MNIVFEVDAGMLYLAVQMPDATFCNPECPVTVSVVQNADGATLRCIGCVRPSCYDGSLLTVSSKPGAQWL